MAYDYAALMTEVETLVQATWPEAILWSDDPTTRNTFTSFEMLRKNIIEAAREDNPDPPYIVIELGSAVTDQDFGIGQRFKRVPCTIYYVGQNMTLDNLTAKLTSLQAAFDSPTRTVGEFAIVENGEILTVEDCPAHRALVAIGKALLSAGEVSWNPGFLVAGV
jgi:hypothetical protein